MLEIELRGAEVDAARRLVAEVQQRYRSVEQPRFQADATVLAQELPRRLRAALTAFRLDEPDVLCVVSGYPIDDERIGDTPAHWRAAVDRTDVREWEFFFYLCSSLLGDPVAWATQQEARIMHDVLPVRGDETYQLNTCSTVALTWHTEDAFHPYRAEYVGLFCLRNPDRTETTIASVADLRLDPATVAQLFRRAYVIEPDNSHRPDRQEPAAACPGAVAETERVAVMFGAPRSPYLRLDPFFMTEPTGDPAADAAFAELVAAVDAALHGVALRPGTVAFIDNFRAVHGRQPFTARYDGRDRWLKRLNITTDLRRSRDSRTAPGSRLIHPTPPAPTAADHG
jgi:Fe(II)/alpha-ketoglutarate-dependent arginine beta-hydroxylase